MPLTVPTHPVGVLPLKLWRPRRWDGVALVLGTIAPDVVYAADGYGVTIHSHAWHAVLWWAWPLTLIAAWLTRWAAPVVAAHLPSGGLLNLGDYGVLGTVRHPWWVTAYSAILGAASHIAWDAVTHPAVDGGTILFPQLHREVLPGWTWWQALCAVSDLLGTVAAAVLLIAVGRSRLLRAWHGPAPSVRRQPVRFWITAGTVTAAGLALLPLQPVRSLPDQAVRCLLIAGLAVLLAAAASRRPGSPTVSPSTSDTPAGCP